MYYFRLVRSQNLLIIFLTQLLVWACVIYPLHNIKPLLLTPENFLLLSFSTVLIAAAGYIINDYFDVRIDLINKPEKLILEKRIPRRVAIILHSILNVVALFIAAVVARRGGNYVWLLVQVCSTVLLWFYSTHFKRQFMTGNVVVAFLTALTIAMLLVYEPALHSFFGIGAFIQLSGQKVLPNPVWVMIVYAGFAFLLTWMREIVKDMEDFRGDEAEGCLTMPIKWGLRKATVFTLMLGFVATVPLLFAAIKLLMKEDWSLGFYIAFLLVLPLIVWMRFLPASATSAHYSKASRFLKLIMVAGVGSLVVYFIESNG